MTAVNISDEVEQICQKLGLYKSRVARITINPGDLSAEVLEYRVDGDGHKFLGDDGRPAVQTVTFTVRT